MIIYEGQDAQCRQWRIERIGTERPALVSWRCWDARGARVLWKSSTWTGDSWSPKRWAPNNAQVPAYLRRVIELRLQQLQEVAR